ncbi:hypothetical protein Daus18300_005448 [Diaporthe australafricana]|uniref:Cytochrome P450 monooxygenase n=1 Tax=Diaporthe australafricana TaxID=127596 RepID=A0ABR3X1B9_9PEZI
MSTSEPFTSYLSPVSEYLALPLLIAAAILFLLYRWALPKPIPGIPYDEAAARSLFGSTLQMLAFRKANNDRLTDWFAQQAQLNRWPLSQFWMAPLARPTLVLADFREVQDILLRRSKEFGRSKRDKSLFANTFPEFHLALTSEDPKYKRNRALVKDLMSPLFLKNVSAPQVYSKSTNLINLWKFKLAAARGRPFDVVDDIFGTLSDTITGAAFALNDDMSTTKQQLLYLQSLRADLQLAPSEDGASIFPKLSPLPYYRALRRVSDHQGDLSKAASPFLSHHFAMLTQSELRRDFNVIREFEAKEIQKSIARLDEDENDLTSALDHLVAQEKHIAIKEGRKPEYYSQRIFDEVVGYYRAGHETTANTASWIVKYLAQNPEVQEQLRSALRAAHTVAFQEGRQPTAAEILEARTPLLSAVIEEVLRLQAPFGLIDREALVDTVVLGHRVPKGTVIFMSSLGPSLHTPALPIPEHLRSEASQAKQWDRNWAPDDIHLFKPERWLKKDEEKGEVTYDSQAGPLLSFGLGPRQCFGKRLAYLQLRILATLFVWNFEFENIEGPLGAFEINELNVRQPQYCYVKLKDVQ